MQEVAVKVKLTAAVCVRAPNAIVARRAAISALLSLTAHDLRIPDGNEATVTEASFAVENRPTIAAIGAKRVKRPAVPACLCRPPAG
jgi:hypothetical protein